MLTQPLRAPAYPPAEEPPRLELQEALPAWQLNHEPSFVATEVRSFPAP